MTVLIKSEIKLTRQKFVGRYGRELYNSAAYRFLKIVIRKKLIILLKTTGLNFKWTYINSIWFKPRGASSTAIDLGIAFNNRGRSWRRFSSAKAPAHERLLFNALDFVKFLEEIFSIFIFIRVHQQKYLIQYQNCFVEETFNAKFDFWINISSKFMVYGFFSNLLA